MKNFNKKFLFTALFCFALLFAESCTDKDESNNILLENQLLKQDKLPFSASTIFYRLDSLKSYILYNTQAEQAYTAQSGKLSFLAGLFAVESSNLVAGKMIIDHGSLQVLNSSKTVDKLKKVRQIAFSKGFLNIDVHRFSRMEISGISPVSLSIGDTIDHLKRWVIDQPSHTISAQLEILDSIHLINFPAKIQINDSVFVLESKVSLDPQKWGIKPAVKKHNKSKNATKIASDTIQTYYPKLNLHIYMYAKTY